MCAFCTQTKVAVAALEVLVEEDMAGNSEKLGHVFRGEVEKMKAEHPDVIQLVRGKVQTDAIVPHACMTQHAVLARSQLSYISCC